MSTKLLPKSFTELLLRIARICLRSNRVEWNATDSMGSDTAVILSEKLVKEKICSRPSVLVGSACSIMKAMSIPFVYSPPHDKYHGCSAANITGSHSLQHLVAQKLKLLCDDCQEEIFDCVDYVKNRYGHLIVPSSARDNKKLSSVQRVASAFCQWVMALQEACSLVKKNSNSEYVATAGVLCVNLKKIEQVASRHLSKLLSSPTRLTPLHYVTLKEYTKRNQLNQCGDLNEIYRELFESIRTLYTESVIISDRISEIGIFAKDGYIDIRTKPHLLCLQHSRTSILNSIFWDLTFAVDSKVMKYALLACRDQLRSSLNISHGTLNYHEDNTGLECLLMMRLSSSTSVNDNYFLVADALR